MNNKVKYFVLCICIVTICLINSYIHVNNIYMTMPIKDFDVYLKQFFIWVDRNSLQFTEIDSFGFISYCGVIFFGYIILSVSMFGINRKYRGLMLLRYNKKFDYVKKYIIKGWQLSLFICILISLCVIWGYVVFTDKIIVTKDSVSVFIFEMLNILLFYCICGIANIYLNIKYNDVLAITLIMCCSMLLLVIDIYVKSFSILAYGTIGSGALGIIIQLIIYVTGINFLKYKLKNMDLL